MLFLIHFLPSADQFCMLQSLCSIGHPLWRVDLDPCAATTLHVHALCADLGHSSKIETLKALGFWLLDDVHIHPVANGAVAACQPLFWRNSTVEERHFACRNRVALRSSQPPAALSLLASNTMSKEARLALLQDPVDLSSPAWWCRSSYG